MRTAFLILRCTVCALLTAVFCVDDRASVLASRTGEGPAPESPRVRLVAGGESHLPASQCRKMIVGPGVNQPDPFPGYRGFVGWESPVRLRDRSMLLTFNAGYWHILPPRSRYCRTALWCATTAAPTDHGFLIDDTYGYSRSCLMPDGSVYIAYIESGGHRTPDARNNSIWSIKLKVRPDHSGIEPLPVLNSEQ